jgi:hypothetical protein
MGNTFILDLEMFKCYLGFLDHYLSYTDLSAQEVSKSIVALNEDGCLGHVTQIIQRDQLKCNPFITYKVLYRNKHLILINYQLKKQFIAPIPCIVQKYL